MSKHDVSHFQKILVIDCTDRDTTKIALINERKAERLDKASRAQELQKMIEELSTKSHTDVKEVGAIAVLLGPGSFTGTRIAVTVANTLHWLYKMPLIAVEDENFESAIDQLQSGGKFEVVNTLVPRD